ncbi:MAG: outer membrane beta-barrel protein [Verrucomicrobiota bacterium]
MKFNKWTLGLAAVGAVSLTSAVRADEAKIIPLQTALSNTTISGYVDTAVQYNPGNVGPVGTQNVPAGLNPNKVDIFSLNDLDIAIDHPLDSTPWAAGYHIDLNYGLDALGLSNGGNSSTGVVGNNPAIRQAYVALSTPVGNGIQWKMGIQDGIIGYEGNTDSSNPNYTRSVGYDIEPATLLGLVGTYQINSLITVQAGVVESESTIPEAVGTAPASTEVSSKAFAGAVAFTAPDSWGWVKGATLNAGTYIDPFKGGADNYYVGLTTPTPWSPLKLGASYDLRSVANGAGHANEQNDSGYVVGLYGNYQATDKLSFNLRGEYYDLAGVLLNATPTDFAAAGTDGKGEELTATIQYNLWANVTSRAEFRWDHSDTGEAFVGSVPQDSNSYILALNVIYTF